MSDTTMGMPGGGDLADMADDVSAGGILDPGQIPDSGKLRALGRACAQFVDLENRIKTTEEALVLMKEEFDQLRRRRLPSLFNECMVDSIGVPQAGVDVEVRPRFHANIKADWPENQREEGFRALEAAGGGDIIRIGLHIHFRPGEIKKAQAVVRYLQAWNEFENRPIQTSREVPWNTLTAFVREQIEAGRVVPLEKLGATVGQECRVVRRK